ncbi:MAG: AraC family transcriptional regulator [Bacteroidota bacterium]
MYKLANSKRRLSYLAQITLLFGSSTLNYQQSIGCQNLLPYFGLKGENQHMFKIPEDLLGMPERHQSIELEGCTVIESCHHETLVADSVYVNQRVLLCILSGSIAIDFEEGTSTIEEGQIGLLNKNVYAPYRKYGTPERGYASVLFFLEDDFVHRFAQKRNLKSKTTSGGYEHFITDASVQFLDFIKSVLNLFYSRLKYDKELLQLKVTELLIYLTSRHPEVVAQLLSGHSLHKKNLVEIMEQNYLKYASLEEFALMSGRSLATFKRDFKEVFNSTPARWLKRKRMEHAQYLLKHTDFNVSDVYNKVGFMNYAHFSRVFKEYFGYGPGSVK